MFVCQCAQVTNPSPIRDEDESLRTKCAMTTPILSERTNFALSDEARIRAVGRDSDDA